MAKQNERATERETTTMTVGRDLANMLRAIADKHNITIPEAIEKYARPCIEREYRKVLDEMHRVLGEAGA